MGKNSNENLESFSAGSRTERPHDPNGWHVNEQRNDQFDANLAAQRAQETADRRKGR